MGSSSPRLAVVSPTMRSTREITAAEREVSLHRDRLHARRELGRERRGTGVDAAARGVAGLVGVERVARGGDLGRRERRRGARRSSLENAACDLAAAREVLDDGGVREAPCGLDRARDVFHRGPFVETRDADRRAGGRRLHDEARAHLAQRAFGRSARVVPSRARRQSPSRSGDPPRRRRRAPGASPWRARSPAPPTRRTGARAPRGAPAAIRPRRPPRARAGNTTSYAARP